MRSTLELIFVSAYSISSMVCEAADVSSQEFPSKPVRIITSGVGGSADQSSRLLAQGLTGPLGQAVVVENRAGTVGAGEVVAKAAPDGYALLVAGTSFWIAPLMQAMAVDPLRDFATISLLNRQPSILVVHPSVPARSVKELITLAQVMPGSLNYASVETGSSSHLAAELFKSMAKVNIVRIPYKSASQQTADLIGGYVNLGFASATAGTALVKTGKLRALAVTSAEPSTLAPGLPTLAASGLPGYESSGMTALFAPVKTSVSIVNRLSQETVRYLKTPEGQERYLRAGLEAIGSSPEELATKLKTEIARMGKLIKDAGIHPG